MLTNILKFTFPPFGFQSVWRRQSSHRHEVGANTVPNKSRRLFFSLARCPTVPFSIAALHETVGVLGSGLCCFCVCLGSLSFSDMELTGLNVVLKCAGWTSRAERIFTLCQGRGLVPVQSKFWCAEHRFRCFTFCLIPRQRLVWTEFFSRLLSTIQAHFRTIKLS